MADPLDPYDPSKIRSRNNRGRLGAYETAELSVLRYRAEVRRREPIQGSALHLYDGGDCSPYGIESLIDLLRSETRVTRSALEVTFEILDSCSSPRLQEVVQRFTHSAIPGLRITISARGQDPVFFDATASSAQLGTATIRRDPAS
jgi:hypothetical protein